MKYSFLLLPVLFFQYCRAQPAEKLKVNKDDNSLLWEISGKGLKTPSYLFGTFHMMCKDDIQLSAQLRQALKNSKEVYLEMDMDDPSNTFGALLFMNMKNGKTLKDLLNAEEYVRLVNFFRDSLGTPIAMLQRMKPNFLEALLYPKMMPCKNMSGVEQELMILAKNDNKEIKGFETIAFQASVFDSIPYEKQAQDLLKTIDSMAMYKTYFDTMVATYKTQQLSEIEKMLSKAEFGVSENQDILLDNRNKNWIIQLNNILPKTNIFIAVGTGHLVGNNGLISLLKKEGYTLKPLQNK